MLGNVLRWGARRKAHPTAGQATVELALVLPVVVLLLMAIIQIALVARDQVLVVQAARAAVREASVAAGDDRVEASARDVLDDAEVEVVQRGDIGDPIAVRVRYRSRTKLPLVGPLIPDPDLSARAVMRREK